MDSKLTGFIAFTVGAAAGTIVSWRYFKQKYEKISQEEIASVKEAFAKREKAAEEQRNAAEEVAEAYQSVLRDEGYTDYSDTVTWKEKEEDAVDKPYVISPEEFGEFDDYEKVSLVYYTDRILADDNDDLVEDVDETVGFDSLNHFGEYEEDSVFVRNDRLRCDYEILLDQRKYSDVVKQMPPKVGL